MNRYKQCRQALGMSQKFVALSVGVSPPMVSQWESGIKEPSKDTLVKLANLFNVTTDYLLFHDETTQKKEPAVSDDELRAQTMERISALPEPVLLKLLELMDAIQSHPADGSAAPAAPGSSDPSGQQSPA